MPVVVHAEAVEIPWRPGYRVWRLAGEEQGIGCAATLALVEPGAGAPLHLHEDADEILILLEGRLEVRLGEERRIVEAGSTISVPAGLPHGFTALGPGGPARLHVFFPRHGVFARTRYLEGTPPAGVGRR
jgi:quercetin dioxygenase-like cupin family protein